MTLSPSRRTARGSSRWRRCVGTWVRIGDQEKKVIPSPYPLISGYYAYPIRLYWAKIFVLIPYPFDVDMNLGMDIGCPVIGIGWGKHHRWGERGCS